MKTQTFISFLIASFFCISFTRANDTSAILEKRLQLSSQNLRQTVAQYTQFTVAMTPRYSAAEKNRIRGILLARIQRAQSGLTRVHRELKLYQEITAAVQCIPVPELRRTREHIRSLRQQIQHLQNSVDGANAIAANNP